MFFFHIQIQDYNIGLVVFLISISKKSFQYHLFYHLFLHTVYLGNKRSSLNDCKNIATTFSIISSTIFSLDISQVLLNLKDCKTTTFTSSIISSIIMPSDQILLNLKDYEKTASSFNTILPNKKLSDSEDCIIFNTTSNTFFISFTIPTITSLYTGKRFINQKNYKAFIYEQAKHQKFHLTKDRVVQKNGIVCKRTFLCDYDQSYNSISNKNTITKKTQCSFLINASFPKANNLDFSVIINKIIK